MWRWHGLLHFRQWQCKKSGGHPRYLGVLGWTLVNNQWFFWIVLMHWQWLGCVQRKMFWMWEGNHRISEWQCDTYHINHNEVGDIHNSIIFIFLNSSSFVCVVFDSISDGNTQGVHSIVKLNSTCDKNKIYFLYKGSPK